MNRNVYAIRVGVRRGWLEFMQSLQSAQDQIYYLVMAVAVTGFLWFMRDVEVDGTDLSAPAMMLPGILAAIIWFSVVVGPGSGMAMEREDGTLLRMKAVPRGTVSYVIGQVLVHGLGLVPAFIVILVPATVLFDDVMPTDAVGWIRMLGMIVLGILATMPIGLIIGAVVPSVQKAGSWGMVPVMLLISVSGIFLPIQNMWDWAQVVVQIFPLYWLGLGMRAAFLPEAAAAVEVAGSWRTWQTIAVLLAWAIVTTALLPKLLKRMANRQSGSAVTEARENAGQYVR